jgi:hypothetical protein
VPCPSHGPDRERPPLELLRELVGDKVLVYRCGVFSVLGG